MNILIVDADNANASIVAQMLSDGGYVVGGVEGSADKAIQTLNERKCDVAIVDANLAGSCASPVASALRKRNIPFVVISGYSQNQLMTPLRSAPFLPRPVDAKRLLALIDALAADVGTANKLQNSVRDGSA